MKDCNSCGKCCIKYSNGQISASKEEIEYWDVFRPDIAEYVSNSQIWVDPKTNNLIERCPWLVKSTDSNQYLCKIYHDRPEDCISYPSNIAEMIRDECEMLEVKDINNPKQAQKDLELLMIDSR